MYNQNKSGFGNSTFGTSTGGLFGNKSTTNTGGLFGNTSTTGGAFGSTSNAGFSGFGAGNTSTGSIFGTPAAKPAGSLFGTPATQQSAFGTSSSTGFGSSTFGQNRSAGGLFGSTSTASTPAFGTASSGGLFGNTGSAFGQQQQQQTGTGHVKFNPFVGTDTMMKSGVSSNIQTKHQCISAMKEYEQKSIEELRVEDYIANRKGPGTGSTSFGTSATSASTGFSFGQKSTASGGLFGSSAKPAFGTAASGSLFGTSTSNSAGGLFGSTAKPAFGAATTSATGFGGFGATSSAGGSLFGNTANKPSGSIFGNTQTSTGGLFGNTAASSGGFGSGGSNLFGNKTSGFGTTTTASSGFGGSNLFGGTQAKAPMFGGSTGFGSTNTNTLGGGSLFGGNKAVGFGTATSNAGSSLFGNTGTQNKSLFGGFGTGATNTLGGTTSAFSFPSSTNTLGGGSTLGGFGAGAGAGGMFGQQNQTAGATQGLVLPSASNQQSAQMLQALMSAPFGNSPLFKNSLTDPEKRKEALKPTNPNAQKAAIQSPLYRINSGPTAKIKLKARNGGSLGSSGGKPHQLFAGLEQEEEAAISNRSFVGRSSVKRLMIKVTPNSDSYPGTPRGSTSSSSTRGSIPSTSNEVNNLNDNDSVTDPMKLNHAPPGKGPIVDTPVQTRQRQQFVENGPPTNQEPPTQGLPRSRDLDDTMVALNVRSSSSGTSPAATTSPTATKERLRSLEEDLRAEEEEEVVVTNNIPHPGGVILTRPGYFTIPSLKEMVSMVDGNGSVKVNNFTIGRTGYGSVYFDGEVDLTNMDLDTIVQIRRKEVTVYPDDNNKPQLGEGLNRRAEVTLDSVWPTDKTTRTPLTDPLRLTQMGWGEKLERTTTKMGAKFLEYRPDTGSWVFQVNHFSKYGLLDSDDEEPDKAVKTPAKKPLEPLQNKQQLLAKLPAQKHQLKTTPLWSTPIVNEGPVVEKSPLKMVVGLGGEGDDVFTRKTPETDHSVARKVGNEPATTPADHEPHTDGQQLLPSSHRMAFAMGVNTQRVQSMKQSFFLDEEETENFGGKTDQVFTSPMLGRNFGTSPAMLPPQSDVASRLSEFINKSRTNTPSTPNIKKLKKIVEHKRLKTVSGLEISSPGTPDFLKSKPMQHSSPLDQSLTQSRSPQLNIKPRPRAPTISSARRKVCPVLSKLQRHKERMASDASLFLGSSFRVGWGPGWMFAHSGNMHKPQSSTTEQYGLFSPSNFNNRSEDHKFTASISSIKTTPERNPLSIENPPQSVETLLLEAALLHSDVISADSDVTMDVDEPMSMLDASALDSTRLRTNRKSVLPILTPNENTDILAEYENITRNNWENLIANNSVNERALVQHLVFSLCNSLWGRFTLDDFTEVVLEDPALYPHQMARKKALVSWLSGAIGGDSALGVRDWLSCYRHGDDDVMRRVLDCLYEGRIEKAVETCIKTGNGRLALLITQSCSSITNRIALSKQLITWENNKSDQFISDSTLKIYSLLAGKPMWLSSKGSINTCENIDWKRSLLVHLKFIAEPVAPITDGIQLFKTAWKGKSEYGVYSCTPVPAYIENERTSLDSCEAEGCKERDICYHLLQLYLKRSHRLDATLCTDSNNPCPLDHGTSWHLWRALYSCGYRHHVMPKTCAALHRSYAAQLEAGGMWHQAVFVLMHLQDNRERESLVRSVLGRHVIAGSTNQEDREVFVTNELGVPESWLHESKALHARYKRNHKLHAEHLLLAQHWRAGHDVIMRNVASDALIHDRLNELCDLLRMIAQPDRCKLVPDWSMAGKLFLDFDEARTKVKYLKKNEISSQETEKFLEEIQLQVLSLCKRVSNLKCFNEKDQLARAEISKQSLNLYHTVTDLHRQHYPSATHQDTATRDGILSFHLPEDYALRELQTFTHNHFIQLISDANDGEND